MNEYEHCIHTTIDKENFENDWPKKKDNFENDSFEYLEISDKKKI